MFILSLLILLLLPTALFASVYKCVSPAGQHSYQDHPCPPGHAASTLQGAYFSQISRAPYQLRDLQQHQQRQAQLDKQLQLAQRQQQQLRQRQWRQKLHTCQRLRKTQQQLQQQLQQPRSPQQTLRLQQRLASQEKALQDAACS